MWLRLDRQTNQWGYSVLLVQMVTSINWVLVLCDLIFMTYTKREHHPIYPAASDDANVILSSVLCAKFWKF